MRYIQKFSTSGAVQEALENTLLGKPYVAFVEDGQYLDWNTIGSVDYSSMPLTFEVLSGGTIWWQRGPGYRDSASPITTIYYSTDSGDTWNQLVSDTAETTSSEISVNAGDIIQFGGFRENYVGGTRIESANYFAGTAVFNIYGNILSMTDRDNYQQLTGFTSSGAYMHIFYMSNVVSAENLVMPDFTCPRMCQEMFSGCTSLTTAPKLPAMFVEDYAYTGMFRGTSLVTAPELPATGCGMQAYFSMFNSCTSLVTPPSVLSLSNMGNHSCTNMFSGCTSLTTAPELPATALTNSCYNSMFKGCTSLVTPPALPATTLVQGCYQQMFYGCTSLTVSPVLPDAIEEMDSYTSMFQACTSLAQITCLMEGTYLYFNNWTNGVAPTGTFYKAPGATWTTGPGGIPDGWTVVDYVAPNN